MYFCGGALKKAPVTFSYEEVNDYLLVERVPAEVCGRCGEKLYTPEVTDALLRIAKEKRAPVKTVQVPVYEFDEVAAAM